MSGRAAKMDKSPGHESTLVRRLTWHTILSPGGKHTPFTTPGL